MTSVKDYAVKDITPLEYALQNNKRLSADTQETALAEQILLQIKELLGEHRFTLWFSRNTTCRLQNGKVVFFVRHSYTAQYIRLNCLDEIKQAVVKVTGEFKETEFKVEQRKKESAIKNRREETGGNAAASPSENLQFKSVRSANHPRFKSLNNFIRGTSNDMAVRAVELALTHPNDINPVYLFGFSGTGKTHLLEGIWGSLKKPGNSRRSAAEKDLHKGLHNDLHLALPVSRNLPPLYLTSEQFVTGFVESIRDNGKNGKDFRNRFKDISVLLIDDIQFLAGKDATQNEFIAVLDYCVKHGIQIVLTGSKSLHELKLRSDVIARLESGIACEIELPERELSLKICQQMAADRKLPVNAEICRYIAQRFGGTARYIQGALNRLHAVLLTDEGKNLTLALAEKVLSDVPVLSRQQVVSLPDIEQIVCETFNIGKERLQSRSRTKSVTTPRMLAMYLARKYTQSALSEIGDFFGKMSHSSVISAQKTVEKWVAGGDKIVTILRKMERRCR
ncbi:chromosomal replication initiator protein DnaA [Planctomycetales bacterium]|nr:chromosomal replication initiator protein DnaA [Planctomycetales bacterium]